MTKPTYWQWFDGVVAKAAETEIGNIMKGAGYAVAHTGGGCLAWEKPLDNGGYLWICDEGNGLGDKIDEPYLVGHYDREGEIVADDSTDNLFAAIAWCVRAEQC